MRNGQIAVFDSGIGGLNVLRECVRLMPCENYIYLADRAHMPYGSLSTEEIRRVAIGCAEYLFARGCKALVVACNTATAVAINELRALYSARVVVGLEPAVKPCLRELGKRERAVALVTPATYGSERFSRLIAGSEDRLIAVPAPELAALIEKDSTNKTALSECVERVLFPYSGISSVVLGCSHYSYLSDIIRELYPGIKLYDGAVGAAERLKYCLSVAGALTDSSVRGRVGFWGTAPV